MNLKDIDSNVTRDNMLVISQSDCENILKEINTFSSDFILQMFWAIDGHIIKSTLSEWKYLLSSGVIVFEDIIGDNDFTINLNRVKEIYIYKFLNEIVLEFALNNNDSIDLTFFIK